MANENPSPDQPMSGPATLAPDVSPSILKEISAISVPQESTQPMANEQFDADLIVIGSGPGGYHAAIRAAQLGASVVCVEREYLGGTCLNWGCIPSKAMIAAAERLNAVKHAGDFGVVVNGDVSVNFEKLMAHKEKVVLTERGGIGMLFKKNKIKHVEGFASFTDPHTISVEKDGQKQSIRGKNFILAMGASAIRIPVPGLENATSEQGVWTSDDAVMAPFIPKRMLVLGGGAVGCEFSFVFNSLGSQVTLVEMMPTLINVMDNELGAELGKLFGRQGIQVRTGASLEKAERIGDTWKCTVKKGSATEEVEVDVILLGVGRKAATDGVNLESIGVKLHRRGVEVVDDTLVTHVPHIYAIGDVTGRIQLAHTAMHEGVIAALNIVKGEKKMAKYKAVPNAVYTHPEVASVGLTEGEAKEKGYDVVVGRSKFMIFGKAMATKETDGFVKVVAEKKYGEVLGVHMIGAHVTDMIQELVVAINHEATLESLAECIHAHPTMSEAIFEAIEDAMGHAIHKM
jgi:dihydrolipoamide dehydrogenase